MTVRAAGKVRPFEITAKTVLANGRVVVVRGLGIPRTHDDVGQAFRVLHDDEDPEDENNQTFDENGAFVPRMRSVIIFVQRCSDCQLVYETLLNLKFQAVALHSRLSQRRRLAALGKFKD